MTEFFIDYWVAVFVLIRESALFLLLGFFLAGLLKVFVSEGRMHRHLGGDDFRSVWRATLYGIPLPLCSCSVLPIASSLRKSGASKGATTSFLISTPETGEDAIAITWALLDPIMTIARPIAAIATALTTGSLVNVLVRKGWDRPSAATPESGAAIPTCEAHDHGPAAHAPKRQPLRVLQQSARFGFGSLLDDLTPWLILGFLISGFISVLIPEGFFGSTIPTGWTSSLLMLAIGMPLYICASASTPVAAALIAKGLDPGAALVFLLAGPATNITTMVVLGKLLGRRVMFVYLLGIALVSLAASWVINGVYTTFKIDLKSVVEESAQSGPGAFAWIATIVLILLLVKSALRIHMLRDWGARLRAWCVPLGFNPTSRTSRVALGIALLALYGSTSLTTLAPGEMGWVVRFGKIVRSIPGPEKVLHWPAPFERVERVQADLVRGTEIGFSTKVSAAGEQRRLSEESEILVGDENLLSVQFSVHYSAQDPYAFHYRVEDADALVRAAAESALRVAAAKRSTFEVYLTHRRELEVETRAILQRSLDEMQSGVKVIVVQLRYAHAPEEVHFEYRDVASSQEDKERRIQQAESYRVETLAKARSEAFKSLELAERDRHERLNLSQGEAKAFLARQAAFESGPEVTRLRLYFEAMERALAKVSKLIYLLGEGVEVDLWSRAAANAPQKPALPESEVFSEDH